MAVIRKTQNKLFMKYIFKISMLIVILSTIGCKSDKNKVTDHKEPIDDYSEKIDSLIAVTHPRFFNGIIQITKNGKTKYLKEFGYSDFENKIPISINDKFRIMSNSKQITAVLILKEVEKGRIDLQNPISEYLPNFEPNWADTITIHQLLNMSSGIISLEKPLLFEPGKGYRYSNPGYGLLGRILEKVTGKEYIQLANHMFKELGMNDSYCYELDTSNEGLINGYWLENGKLNLVEFDSMGFTKESWKDFIPAGGIISNAHDLNIWDTKLHNGEILNSVSHKEMVTPSNSGPHAAFDNDTIGYAYGLRIHNRHPVQHLGHGGRGFGFASIKFYIPEKDVDVIIWENIYARDNDWMAGDIVYHFENEIRKIVLNSSLSK
ncbi:serine hydrolase domain-containing protein [Aquimarina sp. 2201CG14-23]|uniref:serine hydrolase domain-containing protein n=1 Tax=Aquimarina mycalae TaxID=3040073 RepID=UPI0024781543|nr:serine hydrolase domain-containing protein [Aquimarina sp. 2201CG14-23]MDH7444947.1 serine hydrolase domain-containing protein [Aquimarina sp. 2201CG14-23]